MARGIAELERLINSRLAEKQRAVSQINEGDVQGGADTLGDLAQAQAAEAEGLAAESAQARARAAETFREQGAVLRAVSVAEATRAYENAARLQPEHFWTWIELSRLYLYGLGQTGKARDAAERAFSAAENDWDRGLAMTLEAVS
ncbi:MAG: hypothetical protein ACFB2Z_11260 [Maricaulaceae bacterium]